MTYGFIELPEDIKGILNQEKKDSSSTQKQKANFKDAFAKAGTAIKNSITNPTQTLSNLSTFMNDKNIKAVTSTISNTVNAVTTKFSGIAMAQLLIDGKITSKSAIEYLFLGFAPALNQAGIALGYGGLTQLKNAMLNGSLNVGQFIGGFSKIVKGIYQEAKINNIVKEFNSDRRIYFDMTMSDSSNMQSETPDRRVEDGNDLSEFCHNMPITYDVQCELQDGKRYSKAEFRGILRDLRDKRTPITLYLGDEHFNNLILQGFNPSGQGSQKGGYEYTLQFKEITKGSVEEIEIVAFANAPTRKADDVSTGAKAIGATKGGGSGVVTPSGQNGKTNNTKQKQAQNGKSELKKASQSMKEMFGR
jgi:hypothetical protein